MTSSRPIAEQAFAGRVVNRNRAFRVYDDDAIYRGGDQSPEKRIAVRGGGRHILISPCAPRGRGMRPRDGITLYEI